MPVDCWIYCPKYFDIINYVIFCWMICCFMWLATLQFETQAAEVHLNGYNNIGEVYRPIFGKKSCFMDPLVPGHKTKFLIVYPMI